MTKQVAIILINWNSAPVTADCIDSLFCSSAPLFDIIVVDNGSSDDSVKHLSLKYENKITLLKSSTNLGFTGGNNLGMTYALEKNYPYILLLNNDTFVEPHFLVPLIDHMEANPSTGIIQPAVFFHHNKSVLWNGGGKFNRVLGTTTTQGYKSPISDNTSIIKETDWVTGCALLTRSSILRKTGLFASNLFLYYEDVDLSFRVSSLGYKLIYLPSSVIYHIAGMSSASNKSNTEGFVSPIIHYFTTRNRIWLIKKYVTPYYLPIALTYNLLYVFAVMGYFTIRGRFKKLHQTVKGLIDGIKGSIQYESSFLQ